ncbi:MAG: lipopolysaccharide biosynthesis protein [Acidobacteriaceae bacterium]
MQDCAVDSPIKRRLFLGFLSGWVGKFASTIIQLVQVPVFLHYWSVPLYGEWMIISSLPTYLSFSSFGFGSAAGNEMTMMVSRGDREGALRTFQSSWWLMTLLGCVAVFLLGVGLYFFTIADKLKLSAMSETDTKWVLFYLGVSVLLGQLEQLLQAAYRSVGRYPYGSFIKSVMSLAAFACMIVPVVLGGGARVTALVFAVANIAGTLLLCVLVRRDIPWIEYGWRFANVGEIKRLFGPAIAFLGFPIGNALNLPGTLLAVGYALGPTDVVVFGTARTVSRVALQMVHMVSGTFGPEMSSAFGAQNFELTRTLHRRACQMALLVAVVMVLTMMTFGPWFLHHWTGGHVPPSRGLLSVLLLVVVVNTLWATSSTLLAAINQHQRLAAYYVLATGLTWVLCFALARWYGLYGAAWSLLVAEVVMNAYVVPASLKVSHDTWPGFLASMAQYPPSLRPDALLLRLRRPA